MKISINKEIEYKIYTFVVIAFVSSLFTIAVYAA